MTSQVIYELHPASVVAPEPEEIGERAWQASQESRRGPPIRITGEEELLWARMNPERGTLEPVEDPEEATLGFRTVGRRISMDLIMVTTEDHVLVNGVPSLKLVVLGPKDSVMLGSSRMFYVTQRVKPHVGPPTEEMVEVKCPFCRIPITEETSVVTCLCGAIYHNETRDETEALQCFDQINNCLQCNKEVSIEEYIVWDPEAL